MFFFSFFFPFFFPSQIYTIDGKEGGRVVLSAQLSEHVTIGQGRLNQSGIDTLRPFSRSGPRALSIAVLFETENLLAYQPIAYTYFPLHIRRFYLGWKLILIPMKKVIARILVR